MIRFIKFTTGFLLGFMLLLFIIVAVWLNSESKIYICFYVDEIKLEKVYLDKLDEYHYYLLQLKFSPDSMVRIARKDNLSFHIRPYVKGISQDIDQIQVLNEDGSDISNSFEGYDYGERWVSLLDSGVKESCQVKYCGNLFEVAAFLNDKMNGNSYMNIVADSPKKGKFCFLFRTKEVPANVRLAYPNMKIESQVIHDSDLRIVHK